MDSSFDDDASYDENNSHDDDAPYDENNSHDDDAPYDENNSHDDDAPYNENTSHVDHVVPHKETSEHFLVEFKDFLAVFEDGLVEFEEVIQPKSWGQKSNVAWNDKGQPINPGKAKFVNHIGIVARRVVPISYNNWRNVPRSKKEAIWEEIESSFNIDASRKKYVLGTASKQLRTFRTRLTTTYLRDANGNIFEHPPSKYAHLIKQEDWDAFIGRRKDKSFQKLSQENRQRAICPLYPYRGGRLGYAELEQHLIAQKGSQVTSLSRHELWKEGHVNKKGQIDNEHVQRVWDRCVALSESCSGEIPAKHDDILARAMSGNEHPGRVRGLGFGVCHKDYFGKPRRSNSKYIEEIAQLREMLEQQYQKVDSLQQQLQEQSYLKDIVEQQALLIQNLIQMQEVRKHAGDLDSPSLKDSCRPFELEKAKKSEKKITKKTRK